MSANHTPTPWCTAHDETNKSEIATIAWIGEWKIGVATPGYPGGDYRHIDYGTKQADAEHIVRCVNYHDDLVEALLAYVQHDMLLNGGRNDVSLRMRNGVAALKKVGAM